MSALSTSLQTRPADNRSKWPAMALGVALVVGINAFDPISRYVIHSSSISNSHMPFALLVGLMVLAYVIRPLVSAVGGHLTQADLATVLTIGFLGSSMPTMVGRFLAVVSASDYFASAENEWPIYTLPNLPQWSLPSNVGDGIGLFYRGAPPGVEFPWGIWMGPLFWWAGLIVAIIVVCFCLGVVLRKQWSERERLSFPLVQVTMLLVEDPKPGDLWPRFFSERLFWMGFGVGAVVLLWNVMGHFFPGMPVFAFMNKNNALPLGRGFPDLFVRFDFYVICFAYFTSLDVLLSMWFFHLVATLQAGAANRIGLPSGVASMNNYGLAVFVVWGLWVTRAHFGDVWKKAIGRAPEVDDTMELVSYRYCVLGIGTGAVFIFLWLVNSGMGPGTACMYLFSSLILYVGMAKIVALSGLVSLRGSDPTGITKGVIGTWNMSDRSIAATDLMLAMYSYAKGFCMPGAANATKASEHTQAGRVLGHAVLLGALLSLFACAGTTLWLGYFGSGAENFGSYDFTNGNRHGYGYTVIAIKNKASQVRSWWGPGWGIVGGVITAILIVLNHRVSWWPLHPVGFTVSNQYPTRASFFSIFIAWLVKLILIRVGGMMLYNRSKVFFMGLLLGYSTAVLVSFVLDMFFFMGQGHAVHTPPI
jgi:hypothetical protein